ncbi:MAG: winged helix-turn-helix domain-containing protein [Myxococcales bacterium]|nr:winged helix-turn-helix domain-containing protein [Myxococcales bacterium]
MRITFPAGSVDTVARVVRTRTEERPLREKEARLLEFLAGRPNETVTREVLLVEVFDYAAGSRTSTLATTVRRLREALEGVGGDVFVQSVYGEGYRFVPPQVPVASLLGREQELSRLAELLQRSRLVSVVGFGGTGKTTLARAWLDNHTGRFCHLGSATRPSSVISAIARVLGLDPSATLEEVGVALTGVALLVLDEAEGASATIRELIDPLLSADQGLRVLVTSRRRVEHPQEALLVLGPLPADAAAELMRRRAEAVGRILGPDEARRTATLLDGHPLAIELAAGRLLALDPSDLERRLRRDLTPLGSSDADERGLDSVLHDSLAVLGAGEAQALLRLAVWDGSFDLERLAALNPEIEPLALLVVLVEHHLVQSDGTRYRLHRVVRDAALRALTPDELRTARERAFERLLLEGSDPALKAPQVAELLAALEVCDDQTTAARLADLLGEQWMLERRPEAELATWLPPEGGLEPVLQARMLTLRAYTLMTRAPAEAFPLADEAVRMAGDHVRVLARTVPARSQQGAPGRPRRTPGGRGAPRRPECW